CKWFGMNGKHRPQFLERTRLLELSLAVVGIESDVRLDDAQVQLARLDGIDIENRAAGRLDGTTQAMLCTVFIDKPAYGAARCVINARYPTCSDTDKFLLGRSRYRRCHDGQNGYGARCRYP